MLNFYILAFHLVEGLYLFYCQNKFAELLGTFWHILTSLSIVEHTLAFFVTFKKWYLLCLYLGTISWQLFTYFEKGTLTLPVVNWNTQTNHHHRV